MVRIFSFVFFFLITTVAAQERVLLHIGKDGQQEAFPMKKGESARNAIERLEQQRATYYQPDQSTGLLDTLRYFSNPSELTTNFGWTHQDVALQWYVPQAKGIVKEFWWLNLTNRGVLNKGTIRAWKINPRLTTLPSLPTTKYLGAYKDLTDGDGGVQPFKPSIGNQWFYSNGEPDSVTYSFDPMLSEASWLPGGFQVTLDSNSWQGIKLSDWGDTMSVSLGEAFGFTISNDTKKADIGAGVDTRMEIGAITAAGTPYHSLKYYETGRTAPANAGWHLRGDYEWGMYVVIEYITCRAPRIVLPPLGTTLSTGPREFCFTIVDGDCGSTTIDSILSSYVYYKKGKIGSFDSLKSNCGKQQCCVSIPGASPGDTVYWYICITSYYGNRTVSPVRSYTIFKKLKPYLFVYNNAGFSRSNAGLIYTGNSYPAEFDYWSSPTDGTGELSALFDIYNDILIADGNFPARNVYTALKARLAKATDANPVSVFMTSQDYGCYIEGNCSDTTFPTAAGASMEYEYFGLTKIGPQDLAPTNREFRIVPQADAVTNYLIKFGSDSASTLWYDPTFELGFAGYQDAMSFRPGATPLFKDAGTNVLGGKYITAKTRTMFVGFDIGALQFRSDTSLAAGSDPKYKWVPIDVGSIANAFFKEHHVTSVKSAIENVPALYELYQNYPNPFNPATTIQYVIPVRSTVEIRIYNILGQTVATLVNTVQEAGAHVVEWNGINASSGIYFYEMKSGAYSSVKKMLLMK